MRPGCCFRARQIVKERRGLYRRSPSPRRI
jgi:hypothetical protein